VTYVHEGFNSAHFGGLDISTDSGGPCVVCRLGFVVGSTFNFPVGVEEVSFDSDTPVVTGGLDGDRCVTVLEANFGGSLLGVFISVAVPGLRLGPVVIHVLKARL